MKLLGLRYPDSLPDLDFLSQDTMSDQAEWWGAHERQPANVKRHELVVLDGAHYPHRTQSKAMAQKIREFPSGGGAQEQRWPSRKMTSAGVVRPPDSR